MIPNTDGWHSPSGGDPTSADGCADLCKAEVTEAAPYQWAVFAKADSKCFCRLTVEQGANRLKVVYLSLQCVCLH